VKIVLIGFGSIGQGLLPLLLRDLLCPPENISIVSAHPVGESQARSQGVRWQLLRLDRHNYRGVLANLVQAGDVVLNLAVEVSSVDVLAWCQLAGVLYVDTGIDPWPGCYDQVFDHDTRWNSTNYRLRETALRAGVPRGPTAVLAHGANPGLVSHFVKAALFELAGLRGVAVNLAAPDWAQVARDLQVQVIQIAERDTQEDGRSVAPGEFACTWSVDGLMAEARQAPELGWGTHEDRLEAGMQTPADGCQASVVWWPDTPESPLRRVKTWTPGGGEQRAWLITHNESISLADFLSIKSDAGTRYRPTVYYAYSPCRATQVSLENWQASGYQSPRSRRLIAPCEIERGSDELGVLLCFPGGAYWYGSTLDIEHARRLAPGNSATSLQVAAGVLGAIKWALRYPKCGVLEAEQMDSVRVLRNAMPYLGQVNGTLTDWQPKAGTRLQLRDFLEDGFGKTSKTNGAKQADI
jgi:homospermidine synthase